MNICAVCGVSFTPQNPRKLTCSSLCDHERIKELGNIAYHRRMSDPYYKGKRRAYEKTKLKNRQSHCVVCGQDFAVKRNQITCSRDCQKIRRRAVRSEWGRTRSTDQEYRARRNASSRKRKADPTYRKRLRERWAHDHTYREKQLVRARLWRTGPGRDVVKEQARRYRAAHLDQFRVRAHKRYAAETMAVRAAEQLGLIPIAFRGHTPAFSRAQLCAVVRALDTGASLRSIAKTTGLGRYVVGWIKTDPARARAKLDRWGARRQFKIHEAAMAMRQLNLITGDLLK